MRAPGGGGASKPPKTGLRQQVLSGFLAELKNRPIFEVQQKSLGKLLPEAGFWGFDGVLADFGGKNLDFLALPEIEVLGLAKPPKTSLRQQLSKLLPEAGFLRAGWTEV